MQELPRADFAALFHRGTVYGRDVFKLLAGIRRRKPSVATLALALVYAIFLAGTDLRDVH